MDSSDQPAAEPPPTAAQPAATLTALPATGTEEHRTPLAPAGVAKLLEDRWAVTLPAGLGRGAAYEDDAYREAGATIAEAPPADADAVLCITPPTDEQAATLREGSLLVGFVDPFGRPDRIRALAERGVSVIAAELVPRSTIAQPMDALSSQASLAGYAAVLLAGERLRKALPMMSTPAGTIRPAKMLVVGTGVAGLQAIATGVRLGARVTAYDVRDAAREQVESLGARFAKIELEASAETAQGYATEATEEQLEVQRRKLADLCAQSDILITTAQVFGRPAPTIVSAAMLDAMRPGAVVVDAAIATGGNVEHAAPDRETDRAGVTILAPTSLASRVATDASDMFSSNMVALLTRVLDPETKRPRPDPDDDIARATLLAHDGQIRDERVRKLLEDAPC
ncbi:MAG: NAD(P) transhydrogenase subunit alpha [Planctomycetota bacterium]